MGRSLTFHSLFIFLKSKPKSGLLFYVDYLTFLTTIINECDLFIIYLLLSTFYLLRMDLSAFSMEIDIKHENNHENNVHFINITI
jgi:hypothetical protein